MLVPIRIGARWEEFYLLNPDAKEVEKLNE